MRLEYDRRGAFRFIFLLLFYNYCLGCFLSVVLSFISRSLMVRQLYRVSPYVLSQSLWSCLLVLLIEPTNWRLLLLSEGFSVKMRFNVSGVSSSVFTSWRVFP